jgi:hypothetical protein
MFRMLSASILCGAMALGCGSSSENEEGCPEGKTCNSGKPKGPVHPLRADGSVDITPAEAWSNRTNETAPLSASDVANACAIQAACAEVEPGGDEALARAIILSSCLKPNFWEERAVPSIKQNERWSYEARATIAASGGGCNKLNGAKTDRLPEIVCEEVGCWWQSPEKPVPSVTCNGDVATLSTEGINEERDCSRALAACDESSPTGCTDRAPTACEHPAKDRCDGDVRLGCDGTGRVSFHDCGRVEGGQCVGDACVYPPETCAAPNGCNGNILTLCALGQNVQVDCTALGFLSCANANCTN